MTEPSAVADFGVPVVGARIGPYRLVEYLGRGGVALVFRAVHVETGQAVALKAVRTASEGLMASVRRELHALRTIRHPGVVRVFDGGVSEGRPWYSMELLEGGTLREHLKSTARSAISETTEGPGSLMPNATVDTLIGDVGFQPYAAGVIRPPSWTALPVAPALGGETAWFLAVIRRLCEPLAYIHGEGFVHRDLKPSNIFVRTDGAPVLMDFGLAWIVQQEGGREALSIDAARGGTIAYMAPEQARGERMDARGDLFSLGCILYEATTGRVPFEARSRRELVAAHEQPLRPPSRLVEGLRPELEALIVGLLERNPRDRIGHASDVAAILDDLGAAPPASEGTPRSRAKAYLYRPELVGRGALLEEALGRVAGLAEGRGGMALVAGESGIGKTSFAAEVARRAGAQGARVVTSECVAVGVAEGRGLRQGGPLYPLAKLLQAVADRCVVEGAPFTERTLGARAKILATAEPSLREVPGIAAYPEPAEVPGEAARRRLIDALVETVSAFAADRPTLVVLDDLQWADDLTLAFLASLSERYLQHTPVFILATYRSEESTPDLERLSAAPHVATLRLGRLDESAIGTMSADMMGQRGVSRALAAFLGSESSGNPFFVAEYLRAAVDAALLFRDERGRWQQAGGGVALDRLGLPRTLQALVTRRLESLSPASRRLAEVAAVLGREIETEVLGAVAVETGAASDEGAFDDELRTLLVRQVLETVPGGSVRFVHDKLREIAYAALAPERRRALHSTAAMLLEARHRARDTLARGAAILAHHFEQAGDAPRAIFYFDKAGEAAHDMHANQEAVRLLERARALESGGVATSAVTRARRERMLGLNALALGNVKEALVRLGDAAGRAGRPWPRTRLGVVLQSALGLGGELFRRWLQVESPREGAPAGERRELLLEAARAYERLLVVHYYATGDMAAVVLSATVNMGLAERAGGASAERALGYATFAAMCALLPFDWIARSYCDRALSVARESGDDLATTWVRMNVALVHLQAARWPEMSAELEEVRRIARRIGFHRRWEEASSQFSTARLLAGRLDDAAALNAELSSAIERADPQTKCWAIVRDAELHLLKGRPAAALEAAREGERLCEQALGVAEWTYTLGPLALALLDLGDLRGAREAADRGAAWARKGSAPVFYNVFAYAAVAEVYVALWQRAEDAATRRELADLAARAVGRLRLAGYAMAVASPRAFLWRGLEALRIKGKAARAKLLLEESLKRARRLGMAHDEGLALAALGEAATVAADREGHVAAALAIFERIGAVRERERLLAITRPPQQQRAGRV
jgi:serine/threonine protein kinase